MTTNDAVELARQTLSALNYMHSKDVLHRDLHVDNVLYMGPAEGQFIGGPTGEDIFSNGKFRIKLADFGLSKGMDDGDGGSPIAFFVRPLKVHVMLLKI